MQNYNYNVWLHMTKSTRITEEAQVAETGVWHISFLIYIFTDLLHV